MFCLSLLFYHHRSCFCLTCKKSDEMYFGKTKRRVANHSYLCSTIMMNFSSEVNNYKHNINDISVYITSCCYGSNHVRIHTVGTLKSQGMTAAIPSSSILAIYWFYYRLRSTLPSQLTNVFYPKCTGPLETFCTVLKFYYLYHYKICNFRHTCIIQCVRA